MKSLRIKYGYSGKVIAEVLNVAVQHYYNLENEARELSPDYLIKLSDFYGVSIDYLLGRSEPTESTEDIPKDMHVIMRNASKLTPDQLKVVKDITKQFRETNEKLSKD